MGSVYKSKFRSTKNITTNEYDYNLNDFTNALEIEGKPTTILINVSYKGDEIINIKVTTKEWHWKIY